MDWMGRRESDQVEDRRGMPGGRVGTIGCGTVILALVIGWLTGTNPLQILQLLSGGTQASSPATSAPRPAGPSGEAQGEDPGKKFVSVILADTEDTWTEIFASQGRQYELPKLLLFTGMTQTGCGLGREAQGPFYCPVDHKVYLDLSFFRELQTRFKAPGDFAQAYVIAHEVGHHVQQLTGKLKEGSNQASVRQELQADCYAGVWGHHAGVMKQLDAGDMAEALNAASAIGDDRLTKGRVSPDSFTHGSSEQRMRWFKRGFDSGDPQDCDTFGAGDL